MKLGWGDGEASNNHRICLPKSDHSTRRLSCKVSHDPVSRTKEDFTAENGVTYTWEDNRWRTKAYKIDESKLDEYVPQKGSNIKMTGAQLWSLNTTARPGITAAVLSNLAATSLKLNPSWSRRSDKSTVSFRVDR